MLKKLIKLLSKEDIVILPMKCITIYPDEDWTSVDNYQQIIKTQIDNSELDMSDYPSIVQRGYVKKISEQSNNWSWNS